MTDTNWIALPARCATGPAPTPPAATARPQSALEPAATGRARAAFAVLTLGATVLVTAATAATAQAAAAVLALALALVAFGVAWIAGGAATALIGLLSRPDRPAAPGCAWQPSTRTAILLTLCGEDPAPVARRLRTLARDLRTGQDKPVTIHVLSDTSDADAAAQEEKAFASLIRSGAIRYRRRSDNAGRKPGNILDWLNASGADHDLMLVLDADSVMTADRVRRMIRAMERDPSLGLLQAGVGLVPARSRFGQAQRNAVRLLAPGFGAGLAAWSGRSGNYWGHNAIIRVAAFRAAAAPLPVLSGPAPMGGAILSHDFVEAAFLRRAGWGVMLDADMGGSAEDAPQTLSEFHRRDRRWCQGNLQHLRLIGARGLDPVSRLHMAAGIGGYVAAPVWLALVLLGATGAVRLGSALPLALIAGLLLVPKLCGLATMLRRPSRWRTGIVLRASGAEFAVSALVAPLVMIRQSLSVAGVLAGRDCGWKGRARPRPVPRGAIEAAAGATLVAVAATANPAGLGWLVPVAAPLLGAPLLLRWLEVAR